MTSFPLLRLLLIPTMLIPALAAAGPLSRYTLVVGANNGGADRPRLQYAVSDAERFARVMVELGGVAQENEILLREPTVGELLDSLDLLSARIAQSKRSSTSEGGRTEAFLYYSGHADEKGLLLGEDRLSYRSLRDRLDEMPADVRIAVLDACASGAFTRLKGGRARQPFLVDDSHLELRHGVRAGVRSHPRVLLHPLPRLRLPRRRGSLRRRAGHAQRGLSVRVHRNAGPDLGHERRGPAPVLRHQPVGCR
jgi:Caspase domain